MEWSATWIEALEVVYLTGTAQVLNHVCRLRLADVLSFHLSRTEFVLALATAGRVLIAFLMHGLDITAFHDSQRMLITMGIQGMWAMMGIISGACLYMVAEHAVTAEFVYKREEHGAAKKGKGATVILYRPYLTKRDGW